MWSPMSRGVLAGATACCLVAIPAFAEEKDPRPAAGIQDNSFLVEEAYNQEPGVVQHIQTLVRIGGRNWIYNFTQEWPLGSQDNQFSYSVPYAWLRNDDDQRVAGFGPVFLNYRRQAWYENDFLPAFAPRLSLILPTGIKDFGSGSYGLEVRLPFSKIVSDRVTLNANAGALRFFDIDGFSPTDYLLSGSAIYAVTRDFNLMFETVALWTELVGDVLELDLPNGGTGQGLRALERAFILTLNPGFRYAVNFRDDSQLVMGFSVPIDLTKGSAPDYGLLFYLSYEHDFLPKKPNRKK